MDQPIAQITPMPMECQSKLNVQPDQRITVHFQKNQP